MKNLIIIGISKTANYVYEFVEYHHLYNIVGFAVNKEYKHTDHYKGLPIYTLENLEEEYGSRNFCVFVALFWNHLNRDRKHLYDYCKSKSWEMVNLISPTAIIRGKILGDNCWIHDYVIIQHNAILESNIILMSQVLVEPNTHISSHCFLGSKSILGGGSSIGEQCFVGFNAVIFDETSIGKKCIVGACTAIRRHLSDFSKCTLSSNNYIVKQYSEKQIEEKLDFTLNKR